MLIHSIIRIINKYNKAQRFFVYNILSVFIFGFLYWLNDKILIMFPKFSKKYMTSEDTKGVPLYQSFIYYFWFSLITQTTVGYGGITNKAGNFVTFSNNPFWTFKLLNIAQLFSIFVIPVILV
jgi:hypothetical protein